MTTATHVVIMIIHAIKKRSVLMADTRSERCMKMTW